MFGPGEPSHKGRPGRAIAPKTMSVGQITVDGPRRVRLRVHGKALARLALLALLWGGFVCWCLMVMRGQALTEALKAVTWLGSVLAAYLGLTALWIAYNAMLYLLRGPVSVQATEEPTFEKDYFGRPVAVSTEANFEDQHLVLEFKEGKKVYRAPDPAEVEVATGEDEGMIAGGLQNLAAAAGTSVTPVTPDAPVAPVAPLPLSEEAEEALEIKERKRLSQP